MDPNYVTSIPESAEEHITEAYADGQKMKAEYILNGEIVGVRFFHETGEPSFEYTLQHGRLHGVQYRWDEPGILLSAEPYEDGLPHGTAKQWSGEGKLIGAYTLVHGTGIDLWWQDCGEPYLSEVHYVKDGMYHGYEWWLSADQKKVYEERHWWQAQLHGIERRWNRRWRLSRGYPGYYIHGQRVKKRQYIKAGKLYPELPVFREEDNRPERVFPAEIQAHLRKEID